ncbi:MAG: T9SS type A sorting domain-containing protein, partial [Chitinophagales bacterium]
IANPEIQVFSNPSANGIFQFSIPSSSTAATINAYDVCGRKIYCTVGNSLVGLASIDLSPFPKGIYFLEIANEHQRFVSKLVSE